MWLAFKLSMDMMICYMWIAPLTHHLKVWTGIVTVLLMYIGTWFLFQLTFIDLHKPEPMQALCKIRALSLTCWICSDSDAQSGLVGPSPSGKEVGFAQPQVLPVQVADFLGMDPQAWQVQQKHVHILHGTGTYGTTVELDELLCI